MPVMWEYDFFKAEFRRCSPISGAQVGALFAPAVGLPCAAPVSNCLIIYVTDWIEQDVTIGRQMQLCRGAATVCFLFSKETKSSSKIQTLYLKRTLSLLFTVFALA